MSEPKPEFWSETRALAFQNAQVAEAYQYRATYPPETFAKLAELIVDTPRRVLDLGCGTGALARDLTAIADHVDAVDISVAMMERGKQLPNGDSPKLRWIVGRAEEVGLQAPYTLVTAGASLHWMDWEIVLPRLAGVLSPHGKFAILGVHALPQVWETELRQLIRTYSASSSWRNTDVITQVTRRDLFTVEGTYETPPRFSPQSIDAYIESFHARSALAHGRMTPTESAAFDDALRQLIAGHDVSQIERQVVANITWGIPHAPRERGIGESASQVSANVRVDEKSTFKSQTRLWTRCFSRFRTPSTD